MSEESPKPELSTDLLYSALGWCGCSDGKVTELFQTVIEKLIAAANSKDSYYSADPFDQIILLELDRLGLTEHGVAVRGSWFYDSGPWSIERVNKWLLDYCKKNVEHFEEDSK